MNKCLCGCNQPTADPKSNYRPGHDSKHASIVAYRAVKKDNFENPLHYESLPSSELRSKSLVIATKLNNKGLRQVAKQTKKAEKAEKGVEHGIVKVGRWTYEATRRNGIVSYKNGKGELKVAVQSAFIPGSS